MLSEALDVFVRLANIPDHVIGDRWPAECPGYLASLKELWPSASEDWGHI